MQTVLAGPDGKTPAVDATTGQQLTMEEMLRRRGIVAVGNNVAMMGPSAQSGGPVAATTPTSATAAAMQARGDAAPSVVASTLPKGGDPTSADAPPIAPEQVAQMEQLEASGADESSISALEGLGLLAAGTAATYGAYLAWKGLRNGSGNTVASANSGDTVGNRNPQIIDGEFRDVTNERLPGAATRQALQGRVRQQLPAPQKRLGNNSRSATARARAEQAARGSANSGTIPAEAPVRTVREAPDAGLARTLGRDSEVLQVLKRNPGLAKLLATGL